MLTFEWSWIGYLAPLPLLVYLLPAKKRIEETGIAVPFFQQAQAYGAATIGPAKSRIFKAAALSLVWLCLLAAAARPQWIGDPVALPASGRDLLLAVDISGSMETPDMVVNGQSIDRLSIVKYVVGEFVERRQQDRLGLILFGTQAYLQAPLTFDRATVQKLLQEAQLGFAGKATAIGDAIGLAIKRLRNRPDNARVLILLTDGANTAGEVAPAQAAELAQQAGVKIYTIGIGAESMNTNGIFGPRRVNPSSDLDETTLKYIATTTGGQYFRARDPAELMQIYAKLDELEPIEQDAETFRPTKALFYWPLATALGLTVIMLLSHLLPAYFGGYRLKTPTSANKRGAE